MTREELLSEVQHLAEKPEDLETALLGLREKVISLFDEKEATEGELEKHKSKVAALQDTNHRLYLQLTSSTIETEEPEAHEETIDEAYKRLAGVDA